MLNLVEQLNDAKTDKLYRLEIGNQHVGYIRPSLATALVEHAPSFLGQTEAQTISVIAENLSPTQLTEEFKKLHTELAAKGLLPKPADEFTDVRANINDKPICQINRNLIFPLGIISRGVHAILRYDNGDFMIAKRSNKVFTFQGCYDVTVGGLLPSGKDPWDHVKTEAAEEASLSPENLKPNGDAMVLSYTHNIQGQKKGTEYKPAFPFETDGGTNWDEVFYWAVNIPDSIVPKPCDGETKGFVRMTSTDLLHSLRTEPQSWKTNSGVMLLEILANDLQYKNFFTAQEHKDLKSLLIPDPRPIQTRGELPSSNSQKRLPKNLKP